MSVAIAVIVVSLAGAAVFSAWRFLWPRYLLWRLKRAIDDTDVGG